LGQSAATMATGLAWDEGEGAPPRALLLEKEITIKNQFVVGGPRRTKVEYSDSNIKKKKTPKK